MDLEAAIAVLRRAGWDVTPGEGEVVASREDRHGTWTLAVDGAGRVLITATRPLRAARARRVRRGTRAYRTMWEEHGVFTLSTTVQAPEDLQEVLDQLPVLLRQVLLSRRYEQ
ncbi:MAG: hypothetical protein GXP39_16040 [Chloroflexi bacterium]|nr:hypothetical protein [Chloroflexota bacterium]